MLSYLSFSKTSKLSTYYASYKKIFFVLSLLLFLVFFCSKVWKVDNQADLIRVLLYPYNQSNSTSSAESGALNLDIHFFDSSIMLTRNEVLNLEKFSLFFIFNIKLVGAVLHLFQQWLVHVLWIVFMFIILIVFLLRFSGITKL